MNKELELWQFVADRLKRNEAVMLLVVATSSGSSPGRQGYKMAVGSGGELLGSIGGGVMEVALVEESRTILGTPCGGDAESEPRATEFAPEFQPLIKEQVHRKNAANASGMICSGKQTVIFRLLTENDAVTTAKIIESLRDRTPGHLLISNDSFVLEPAGATGSKPDLTFEKHSDIEFTYAERLGFKNDLYIVGGGHCALALSELMSKMDFHISLFDDRPELNTIAKNQFAHEMIIIDGYDHIADHIPSGDRTFVVVMTLGYKSDEVVIRKLLDKDLTYFGVLGSKAKMHTLINSLIEDGLSAEKLAHIHTPIGLAINSHTPEEIAVSIAAEIISVKNQSR